MSNTLLIIIIVLALLVVATLFYVIKKRKGNGKSKKEKKVKPQKRKKVVKKEKSEKIELRSSYVDVADKFLFRKEVKVLIIVSRILPKGYIVFPKVGADLILVPVGSNVLYDSVKGKYIDLVIFEEETMKPRVAIDLFDGTIGDEQIDVQSPEVMKALLNAEMPLVSIKVKTEYKDEEVKDPILKALGIKNENGDK